MEEINLFKTDFDDLKENLGFLKSSIFQNAYGEVDKNIYRNIIFNLILILSKFNISFKVSLSEEEINSNPLNHWNLVESDLILFEKNPNFLVLMRLIQNVFKIMYSFSKSTFENVMDEFRKKRGMEI